METALDVVPLTQAEQDFLGELFTRLNMYQVIVQEIRGCANAGVQLVAKSHGVDWPEYQLSGDGKSLQRRPEPPKPPPPPVPSPQPARPMVAPPVEGGAI